MTLKTELLEGTVVSGKIVANAPSHLKEGESVKLQVFPSLSAKDVLVLLTEMAGDIVPGQPIVSDALSRDQIYQDRA
jgi:hypothetical protein